MRGGELSRCFSTMIPKNIALKIETLKSCTPAFPFEWEISFLQFNCCCRSCCVAMPQLYHVCSHIQNASKARQAITSIPTTRLNLRLALAMKTAGFLASVRPGDYSGPEPDGTITPVTPQNIANRRLWLGLKYVDNERVITKCETMSRSNRRLYFNLREIEDLVKGRRAQTIRGLGMGECMFIGTDKGVFEARDAVRRGVGGEALCRVS
jgi:small subunit ribosomal protein S8